MYKNILIASDGSELAQRAVSHGLALAKTLNAGVTAVTVTELWRPLEMSARIESGGIKAVENYEKGAAANARKILSAIASTANEMGVSCETVHVPDQHPADGIVATAKDKGCDLIIMASHGRRGVNRLLLGSVANEVLTHCSVPALIYR